MSMLLKEKTKKLEQLMQEVSDKENLLKKYNEYDRFYQEVKKSKTDWERYLRMAKLLHKHNPASFSLPDVGELLDGLDIIIGMLEQGNKVPRPRSFANLSDKIKEHENMLAGQWKSYVDGLCAETLQILRALKNILDEPSQAKAVIASIHQIRNTWPLGQNNIDNLEKQLEKGREIIKGLDAGAEVQNFLIKLSTGRARLSDLTDRVKQWFDRHNLADKLEISFVKDYRMYN